MSDKGYRSENKIRQLEQLCREQAMPLTIQRRIIMEALAGRTDHPSADQVYEAVCIRLPDISRTTVYRVLEAFVKLGAVRRIEGYEAKARFDADMSSHHHVQCRQCGVVVDIHGGDLVQARLPAPQQAQGFTINGYSVIFSGYCVNCSHT